jgi:hypothetical protein
MTMGIRHSLASGPYQTSDRKTFKSALCNLLQVEFPGIFGPMVTDLFAQKIDELYERFHPPRSRLKPGQVLWTGVAIDDPPSRSKRIENTRLVPVILDLVTVQDIEQMQTRGRVIPVRLAKIVRLFRQAYEQGAVLCHADVSLLLNMTTHRISKYITSHEHAMHTLIPRRGTIHDIGRSVTHKAIICYKSLVEKKPTSQVAQETFHSPEDVEHYVQCFRRIQLCRDKGLSRQEIAQATGHSIALVQEYIELMEKFHIQPLPDPDREEDTDPEKKREQKRG